VHRFDSSENDARTSEIFEAEYRPGFSFNGSMILLHDVIEKFALPDQHRRAMLPIVILDPGFVRAALINVGDSRKAIVLDGAREEASCSTAIAFGGEQEIHGAALLIYRAIPVPILAANLDVRFV
jgi:hypothetical protein